MTLLGVVVVLGVVFVFIFVVIDQLELVAFGSTRLFLFLCGSIGLGSSDFLPISGRLSLFCRSIATRIWL